MDFMTITQRLLSIHRDGLIPLLSLGNIRRVDEILEGEWQGPSKGHFPAIFLLIVVCSPYREVATDWEVFYLPQEVATGQ